MKAVSFGVRHIRDGRFLSIVPTGNTSRRDILENARNARNIRNMIKDESGDKALDLVVIDADVIRAMIKTQGQILGIFALILESHKRVGDFMEAGLKKDQVVIEMNDQLLGCLNALEKHMEEQCKAANSAEHK